MNMKHIGNVFFQKPILRNFCVPCLIILIGFVLVPVISKGEKSVPFIILVPYLIYAGVELFYLFVRFLAYKTSLFRKMKNKRSFTIWTTIIFTVIAIATATMIWLLCIS